MRTLAGTASPGPHLLISVGGPNTILKPAAAVDAAMSAIPHPGLGTWQITDPDTCRQSVRHAIDVGYRHIDTARAYGNEEAVGAGIRASEVDRDDLFVATKLWYDDLGPDDVVAAGHASLDRLGLEYLDLLYLHWPAGPYEAETTLPAMQDLVADGTTRALGVSNFTPALLDEAVAVAGDDLIAHQFEMHAHLPNEAVHAATREHDLTAVAYSPLGRGSVLEDPVIREIAADHDTTPAQVALAWVAHHEGTVPIPKSATPAHIEENLGYLEVSLTDAEIERINRIDRSDRQVSPPFAPW